MKALLLAAALVSSAALAQSPDSTVTLPEGVVVKEHLPGAPRGNPQSDKADNPKKVYICHATSAVDNNGYLIVHVGRAAADAHLKHEHATAEDDGHGQGKAKRDRTGRYVGPDCADNLPS
ncbi:hypothetical protein ACTQ9L_02115 [Deinococcus wulumuqiensis]|uniref:hypothetical protein n=1 Tax=Deinococcus wulumuqiensis TaxID=980427 RepID=UPI00242B4BA3|nr:hypothetical protein [Deinococcus wulumuqiensis]